MSLFRQEALSARQHRWLGAISLAQPIPLAVLAAISVLIAGALIAFLYWGEFTRKERVVGQVVMAHGMARIYSPVVGTVTHTLVEEGQAVRKGQALYTISVERSSAKGETQAAIGTQIAQRRNSYRTGLLTQKHLFAEQQRALRNKIADQEAELRQLQGEIATQAQRLALNSAGLKRFRDIAKDHFISAAQLEEREQENLDQQARLSTLQRGEITLKRDISAAASELRSLPLLTRTEEEVTQRNLATIEQEDLDNEVRRETTVVAQHDGTATAILAQPGQMVTPATPLLTVVPTDAKLQAYIYAPSRAIGLIRPNATVLLRYQAFPYQKFGQYSGRIKSISRAALSPSDLQLLNAPPEYVYRITVELETQYVSAYGKRLPLQDGMQLEADVLLESRKLYEWVLEPLYSVAGKI
jgi:membrane fusion protein